MDIHAKKLELIQWLTSLNDVKIIDEINKLRKTNSQDWWATLSDDAKTSIEKGISDADNGKLIDHSEIRKGYERWL